MEPGETQDLQKMRVALFSEEAKYLRHYLSILRLCGFREVVFAEEMPEALKAIIEGNVQLIFVVHLGEAEAVTRLISELHGLDATAHLPVVAITDETGARNSVRIYAKGVAKILVEPLSGRMLDDMMREIFGCGCEPDRVTEKVELAGRLVKRGEIERARIVYEDLLLSGCARLDVYLGLARIHTEKGEWLEGEGTLKRAMDLARNLPNRLESSLGLATVFHHYGEFYDRRQHLDKALKSYRTAVTLNPYYTQAILALLDALHRSGELVEILTVVRGVRERFSAYSQPLSEVAERLVEIAKKFRAIGMLAQARDVCREILTLPHCEAPHHLKAAEFLLEHGRVSFVVKRLAELGPKLKSARIFETLAGVLLDAVSRHLSRGRWAKSSEEVDIAILQELDPNDVTRMAMRYAQQGLLLEPDLPGLKFQLARARFKLGDREGALELLDALRASQWEDPAFLYYGAARLLEDKITDPALSWLLDGMSRHPEDYRFFLLCSECLKGQGKLQESARCLRRGLAVQPDNTELMVAMGETCIELGVYSEAVALFQRAQRLRPNDPRIRNGLETATELRNHLEKGRAR